MNDAKKVFCTRFHDVPTWGWLALLLAVLYALRYYLPLSERVLLWDDFFLLADSATPPRFQQNFLYTFLHFVPFLRLAMLGFMQLPLSWLPLATSLWTVFWVSWLCVAFFRLARLYGISPAPALLGIAFIVFNPMFAEVQIWLTSTFYLVALVFVVEGLVQLEWALVTNRTTRWVAAAAFSLLAPCAWSTGYIAAILYLVIIGWGWRRVHNRKAALIVVAFAFLAYPALRLLGEYLVGHTYLSVTPWSIPQLLLTLLKIIGDGLVFGSLGLWRTPDKQVAFPGSLLIMLTLALITALAVMYWRWPIWRKQLLLAAVSIVVALAIPIYFRGTQFQYADFRWFIRYFTTPLFGLGLVVALAVHETWQRSSRGSRYVGASFVVMLLISFTNRMPEHYVGGGHRHWRLHAQQVAQLRFLDRLSDAAHRHGVGAQPLINAYFVPIEGSLSNVNGAGLYTGYREPNNDPIAPAAHQALVQTIRTSCAWQGYAKLTFTPELSGPILDPKGNFEGVVRLVRPHMLSSDVHVDAAAGLTGKSQAFVITGGDPYLSYVLPAEAAYVERILLDVEIAGRSSAHIQVTLAGRSHPAHTPSLFVSCPQSRCRFDIPVSRLPWFPPGPYSDLRIDPDGLGQSEPQQQLLIHNLAIVPGKEDTPCAATE